MRELAYIVPPTADGRTLGSLLAREMKLSHHRISSLKFSGGILLDGRSAHTGVRVHAGQLITVVLTDAGPALTPLELPLTVPYRDNDLLIVDKPAPLPAIQSAHQGSQTLENALFAWLGCPEGFIYRPVSRLDKGTSGLMPVALNAHMHDRMQRLLHTADYVREYLAVTEGAPAADAGVCDGPIAHADGVRRCVDPSGKPAVTHYTVLRRAENGRALLRLRLETGRTHQIRVHMAHMGCPVAGDYLYGAPLPQLPGRFALHSALLSFTHPLTGRLITLESPLPAALAQLLEKPDSADIFIRDREENAR